MKAYLNQDVYVGLSLIIVSALFVFLTADLVGEAKIFPLIFLVLNIVFSVFIIIKGFNRTNFNTDDDEEKISVTLIQKPLLLFLGTVLYTLFITWIGFFLATIIFLVSFIYLNKYKSHKVVFLTTLLTVIFVYLVFVYQLNVSLPSGILFGN